MSSSTGVRESNDNNKRVIKGLIQNEAQFIQSLRVFANTSTLSGLGSTEGEINNSPKDPSGNYLSRLGDTMLGPLALSPPLDFRIVIDANNTIDIGPLNDNAQYTSNVQLDSIQPNSFVLDIIAGAAFDGQLLFLRTFAPSTPFTISQGTLGNGGNIQTGDGNDLTVGDLQTVTLIFDEALKIEANTGGSWRVLSVSSGNGGGEFFGPWTATHDAGNQTLLNLTALQITDSVGGVHGLLQGLAATGVRLSLTAGEQFNIFDNITNIFQVDNTGVNLFGRDLGMGTGGNIIAGGAGEGMTNIGHLDFVDNLATPVADQSIYSDGTFLIANTNSSVGNIFVTPAVENLVMSNNDITMGTGEIIAGGAGKEIRNIGELVFVNNTLSPAGNGIIFFDGTDLKAKTGTGTVNLSDIDGSNFTDAVFRVVDELDATKKFAVDVGTNSPGATATLLFGASSNITLSFPNATTIIPGLSTTQTFIGSNTFSSDIIAGGAGEGVSNIGNLRFVDNLATPVGNAIYSDGTDLFANSNATVINFSNILTNPLTVNLDFDNNDALNINTLTIVRDDGTARMTMSGGTGASTQVIQDLVTGVDWRLSETLSDIIFWDSNVTTLFIPRSTTLSGSVTNITSAIIVLGDNVNDLISFVGKSATDLNMATFDINNIDQLNQEAIGGILTHTFARPETLADDTIIGDIRFRAFDGLGTINNYASIRGIMKSDVNTGEDGGIQFFVAEAGTHDVLYMEINGNNNLEFIQFFKTVQIGEDIRMGGNPLILDTSLTTEINGFIADTIQFLTNSALRASISNTVFSVINDFSVLGTTTLGDNIAVDKISINAQIRTKLRWDLALDDAPLTGEMAIGRDSLGNLKISAPTGEHIGLQINASDTIRIFSDKVEFNDKIIFPISAGALGATQFGISRDGSEMQINTDATFKILVDAVEIAQFGSSFIQFPEVVSDPAAGSTSGKFYVKTVGGFAKPFFIGDGTAAVDLSSGGGASNLISQLNSSATITDTGTDGAFKVVLDGFEHISADNSNFFTLKNMGLIINDVTSGDQFSINQTATDVTFTETTGNSMIWSVGGVQMTLTSTLLTINNNITLNGDLDMTGGDIDNVDDINFSSGGQIQQSASGINFDTPSGDFWRARAGTLTRFEITNANDVLITAGLGTLTFATGNGTLSNIILRDVGNFDFRVATNQDMIFFEAATEIGRYDGGLNKWEFNPSSEFAVNIASSEKLVIDSGTIEVTPNVALFSVRSGTINLDSATINMGNAVSDKINWVGQWQFSFIPAATNSYDIGTSSLRVREIFSNNVLNVSFSEFKKDIVSLDNKDCMDICGALDTIEYKWNNIGFISDGSSEDETSKNRKYVGFNADALRTMLPNAVKDDMIYPNAVTGLLLGSVRHLESRESELENRIIELENRITELEEE